jgi:hypothetical protein
MPDEAPRTAPYSVLCQVHECYSAVEIEKLDDLYKGGFEILRKAKRYLVKVVNEHDERFGERCAIASYQPYFAQIVDQFTSDLFGQPLSVKPAADSDDPNTPGESPDDDYYESFEKDVDEEGTSLVELFIDTLRTALVQRTALVAVDAPDGAGLPPPANKAEEEARGTKRLYAYPVPVVDLINWKLAPGGKRFEWAVLYTAERLQPGPLDTKNVTTATWTLWGMGAEFAEWQRYRLEYTPEAPPQPDTKVPLVGAGVTTFREIPLLQLALPDGLWVGAKIGPQALEHWQRRSTLISSENRSLVAIPYVQLGPRAPAKGGAIPSELADDPGRADDAVGQFTRNGMLKLDAGDIPGFMEPSGKCYEIVDKQLDALRDAMFSVNHQMAASIRPHTPGAVGRSGASKQKDEDSTARVLRALGRAVRQFAVKLYDVISTARGEDIHWDPHGLDAYDSEDREQILEEAVSIDEIQIPSVTFRKAYARSCAEKLLRGLAEPATMAQVIAEIEKALDADQELRDAKAKLELDQAKNPPPPPMPIQPATAPQPAKVPAIGKGNAGASA